MSAANGREILRVVLRRPTDQAGRSGASGELARYQKKRTPASGRRDIARATRRVGAHKPRFQG